MAKQAGIIQRFDGGLNNRDSQKDLTEGFLSDVTNVDVSHIGTIKSVGKFVSDGFDNTIDLTPSNFQTGVGLFTFRTDVGADSDDAAGEYIAYTGGNGEVSFGSDVSGNTFNHGFAQIDSVVYQADGSTANLLAEDLDTSETGITVDYGGGFHVNDIIKINTEYMLITAIASNILTVTRDVHGTTAATHDDDDPIYKVPTLRHSGTATDSQPVYYYADGGLRVADADLTNTGSTAISIVPITRVDGDNPVYDADYSRYYKTSIVLTAPADEDFDSIASAADPDDAETNLGTPSGKIKIGVSANTAAGSQPGGLWAEGAYVVGVSYVYYGGQESKVSDFLGHIDVGDGQYLLAAASIKDASISGLIQGLRVYVKNFNDAEDEFVLLLDIDFEQGSRVSLGNEFDPLVDMSGHMHTHDPLNSGSSERAYAIFNQSTTTYAHINGYDMEEHAISFQNTAYGYKTAVVANQRAFVANIRYPDADGKTRVMGDRIQYTPVRKYDTFPQTYYLDIATNDGDEIIKLEEFQDRLFIFKKNKLFILDISAASDFEWAIIGEFDNRGVSNPGAVSKSDVGVVWANEYGLFAFSDGITKLSVPIDDATWATNIDADNVQVGYIPKKNQIVVIGNAAVEVYQADGTTANLLAEALDSSETGVDVDYGGTFSANNVIKVDSEEMLITSISTNTLTVTRAYNGTSAASHSDNASITRLSRGYLYDVTTSSFVNLTVNNALLGSTVTNFVRFEQELCIMGSNGTLYKFDTTAAANRVVIQTKEFDFGLPSVDKKIYSIYVTYKDANNVSLTYGLDGATPTTSTIDREGTSSNALSNSSTRATHKFTFESSTVCKSIQLKFSSGSSDTETGFEIEDISIIYRLRVLK